MPVTTLNTRVTSTEIRPFYGIGPYIIKKPAYTLVDYGTFPVDSLNNILISIQNDIIEGEGLSQGDFAAFIIGLIAAQGGGGGGGGSDKYFLFTQSSPSTTWSINHNLAKNPSVTVVDSAFTWCIGDIDYIDTNNLTVSFSAAFAGYAYLN